MEQYEEKKNLTFTYTEPKETKEYKVDLNGTNTEKMNTPTYDDHSKHETMFILIKRFNVIVEDGDLFKEHTGTNYRCEANRETMTPAQLAWKLN